MLNFITALTDEIQSDLYLLPQDRRNTLIQVKEQAQIIYRRLNQNSHKQGGKEQQSFFRSKVANHSAKGDRENPQKRPRVNTGRTAPIRANVRDSGPPEPHRSKFWCKLCNISSHTEKYYRSKLKDPKGPKAGKD